MKYRVISKEEEKEVLKHFKKDKDNRETTIATTMNISLHQVKKVINKYLMSINLRKY